MPGYIAKNDIYDENGVLLISKGKKLSSRTIRRLLRRGDFSLNDLIGLNDSYSDGLVSATKSFEIRKNIPRSRTLECSSQILGAIIIESRTKPWWIYVNALSNYLDWLYTHSIDVAMISLMMAMEMGYKDKELWNIGLGSLLHDVGKLLVPKPILDKTEPLTDKEFSYIRQHCVLGVSSLQGFNLPKEYTDLVLQHHERLDGSGYPYGLTAEEICPNAKIVMIADAVDAITSYRPYRKPQTMDVAIKRIRNEKEKYPQDLIDLLENILR